MIAYAGAVPLQFQPVNEVEWLDPGPGLRFERRGIAYSEEALHWRDADASAGVAVELWVVPANEPNDRLGQIFSLFDGDAVEPLLIAQWKSGLVVRNRVSGGRGGRRYRELGALGMLFRNQARFIAVTSGQDGTGVSLDGRETELRSNIPLIEPGEDFGGRLVLGNSSSGAAPWQGNVLGVAVYRRKLSHEEIAGHEAAVRTRGFASLAGEPGLAALYSFDERRGEAVRSRGGTGPVLLVPLGFQRLRMPVLQLPDLRGRRANAYGRDALLNVVGFAPLGFFAAAVLRRRRWSAGSAVAGAVLLGFGLSLAIELLQVMLPGRVSSATDLISNVLGSGGGAWLALLSPWSARLAVDQ
ncbi:MAG: VanZ family protein [Myxococcota bacterium]